MNGNGDTKKVLIITYRFPPQPGPGPLRLKGLAKYLPEFGWEPIVLTTNLPGEPDAGFKVIQAPYPGDVTTIIKKRLGFKVDKDFQDQIMLPRSLKEGKRSAVRKLLTIARGIVAYPDNQKKWIPVGISFGSQIIEKDKVVAILSSSGPISTHLIAKELKLKYDIPWVADLRDLWTQNHYYPYGKIRRYFERRLEIRTLAVADALTTVSDPLARRLKTLHVEKPVFSIPNGFDPEEAVNMPLSKEFTITYTGKLYHGKRDPRMLLKAISDLISEGCINPNIVKVRFFGRKEWWLEQDIKKYRLEGIVVQLGEISRRKALEEQSRSQVLLLLGWNHPEEKGVYTAKVFEYLLAKRPILAIGFPRGVITSLLEETSAGYYADDLHGLREVLKMLYSEFRSKGFVSFKGDSNKINKYSYCEMARKFAEVFGEIC